MTESDKELLELAAKAAENGAYFLGDDPFALYTMVLPNRIPWDPLHDMIDTIELEIKLRLDVVAFADEWHVTKRIGGKSFSGIHEDRQRATTICAAEIGRAL